MKNELKYLTEQELFFKDRIDRGIEQNRKGRAILTITDENGNGINPSKVTIKQKTHDFKFGCNLFLLDSLESEERTERYKEYFKNLFNLAIVPFFWGDLEPTEGSPRFFKDSAKVYRRPAPDLVLEFCRENNIEPKGHTLMWHQILPDWLKRDSEGMKPQIVKRFKALAERYAEQIGTWDVVNEALIKQDEKGYRFPEDYVYWNFRQAEKYFKENRLFINDTTENAWHPALELSAYSLLIENLLLRGIEMGGIGMQYHMFYKKEALGEHAEQFFNPDFLFRVLDNYNRFKLPLHVSEVTIPSYETSAESEELQAELLKRLYRIWFSHPGVEAIIWWNLVDGYAYKKPGWDENYYGGGLIKNDFTPKKAYGVLEELIKKEWHTELSFETGSSQILWDGFYGRYEIIVEHNGRAHRQDIHLSKTGPRDFEIMI